MKGFMNLRWDLSSRIMLWALPVLLSVSGAVPSESNPGRKVEVDAFGSSPRVQAPADPLLRDLLEKTGAYCERVKAIAYHFVCREKMLETVHSFKQKKVLKRLGFSSSVLEVNTLEHRKTNKKTYVYDYQMIKTSPDRQSIVEQRTLLEENGRKKNQKNARLKLKRFWSKYPVFGPVGFLSRYWQEHFHYRIGGREILDGRRVVVLTAVPVLPREDNYYLGKIWVDESDFSVLQIEWIPKSPDPYTELVSPSLGDMERELRWTITYGLEKNGVRFPSRQTIEEHYVTSTEERFLKYAVTIEYDDYKFFVVETTVKYDD